MDKVKLKIGEVDIYKLDNAKLHAYKTNDPIDDEVFIIEKEGKAVVIESPCFFDNIAELEDYLKDMDIEAIFISYHAAGGSFLKGKRKISTDNAICYSKEKGGKALIDKFSSVFGKAFDSSCHMITDTVDEGEIKIANIVFEIKKTSEAYDMAIPEMNIIYTHMLGHDCHSIVGGENHAKHMIEELKSYLENGYSLILSSHYTPENLKDVEAKIAYLENLQAIAKDSKDKEEFIEKAKKEYLEYSGLNYLEMTASAFFNE